MTLMKIELRASVGRGRVPCMNACGHDVPHGQSECRWCRRDRVRAGKKRLKRQGVPPVVGQTFLYAQYLLKKMREQTKWKKAVP